MTAHDNDETNTAPETEATTAAQKKSAAGKRTRTASKTGAAAKKSAAPAAGTDEAQKPAARAKSTADKAVKTAKTPARTAAAAKKAAGDEAGTAGTAAKKSTAATRAASRSKKTEDAPAPAPEKATESAAAVAEKSTGTATKKSTTTRAKSRSAKTADATPEKTAKSADDATEKSAGTAAKKSTAATRAKTPRAASRAKKTADAPAPEPEKTAASPAADSSAQTVDQTAGQTTGGKPEAASARADAPDAAERPDSSGQADAPGEAPADAGETADGGTAKKSSRRGSRGRGRKKAAAEGAADDARASEQPAPQAAAAAPEPAGGAAPAADPDAPADFPTGFDDSGPEDAFAAEESAGDEADGGKKRRRSRRGGRGRKKSGQATAADGPAADSAEATDEAGETDPDDAQTPEDSGREGRAKRKMFVSVLPGEQVEVVIAEEGQVQEYYVEMLHQAKTKGNIYKGVVHNVDPNLQAAFVSYGAVKNGFLQIDEVHPEYFQSPHEAAKGRKYPPIQKVLKAGQELLVQVVKEPAGTKGAFLTTYLSLPGRFLVLTPGREQIGVSRKVDDEEERGRLRALLDGLSPGAGLGVIVRTVSMGASKTSLQRDLQYLKRTWKEVRARGTSEKAPCLIYQERDLVSRAVRDYLTDAIGEIWVDDGDTAASVAEVAEALFPRKKNLVREHKESGSDLFERFNIQRQLDQIQSREVSLPSGGRLVIDPTEALTAIDINSGRSGGKNNFEDMAYRTNIEAARMIPLQLRLRDIGGQIVVDFIEMRDKNHWREVEKTLRAGMKVDRARYDVGKISAFGLMELVRQRLGSSAISISTEPCPCCKGTGIRRNMEWQSQHSLRDILRLLRAAEAAKEPQAVYETDAELALHLLNHKRARLAEMEQTCGVRLEVRVRQEKPAQA